MIFADLCLLLRVSMRTSKHHKAIEALLREERVLTTEDFRKSCPGLSKPSVYSRIRSLVTSGRLSRIGQGKYIPVSKPSYPYHITPWMKEVNSYIQNCCIGINFCLCQKKDNLFIEAAKSDLLVLENTLKQKYDNVAREKDARPLLPALKDYIILKPMVSDAPVFNENGVNIPSIEKEIIDSLEEKKEQPETLKAVFQKKMEIYPVNLNRLNRYAARRGLSEELSVFLRSLDYSRMDMFSKVQRFLSGTAITKAWVFGSFAKNEETSESDLDLLVDYDKSAHISLLDLVRYKIDLEQIINREVDLITNGSLKPFAVESANKDKYLIYER